MGLIRLMKRFGGGCAAVQPTDQIACDLSLTTVTPTNGVSAAMPDVLQAALNPNSGTDNNAATYGVFGIGLGVVASTDLGLMSSPITQVSDLGLMSSSVTTTIDLGLFSA